jgi:hypothetical protein
MADVNGIDPKTLSTTEFARLLDPATGDGALDSHTSALLIKHASDEQLDAVLVSGNSSPTMTPVTGTLELTGDIGFATRLTKIFDMPKA